ncbi:MAG: dihydroorotase [Bdellovibrionota bacterium]
MITKISQGHVVDPSQNIDQVMDVYLQDDHILGMCPTHSSLPVSVDRTLDASGKYVAPGFVDIHVHLRDPGQTHKEDIETGSQAAVAGGFTSIMCMPNTVPAIDSVDTVAYILKKAKDLALCHVYPVGAVSKNLMGKELTPLEDLKKAGCVAFSDDGKPVEDTALLRKALERTRALDVPLIEHCEESDLSRALVTINEGNISKKLGIKGLPHSAETVDVARLIALSLETKAKVHLAHLSCAQSVEFLKSIRDLSHSITSEVTPHHLLLTDQVIETLGTCGKMYPPLRTEHDVDQMVQGLSQGWIDAVATDHAPHTQKEKNVDFAKAPNGVIGLETALEVLLVLVQDKKIALKDLIAAMSTKPAKIMGLPAGTMKKNAPADVVVFSIEETNDNQDRQFRSKSQNTAFRNFQSRGKIWSTFVQGREVFSQWS